MVLRKIFLVLWLSAAAGGVGYLFWQQEVRYVLPTPVPVNYTAPPLQSRIALPPSVDYPSGKPLFLHFFNPDCPCSRFNVTHFNYLQRTYGSKVTFLVVIPEQADPRAARELIGENLPVIQDTENQIAEACGVYSSPQAVLFGQRNTLYYRGNYNKARYCTLKASNYAEMALNDLLEGKPSREYGLFAQKAWGCELGQESFSSILQF